MLSLLFSVITWKVSFDGTWGMRAEMERMKDFRSIRWRIFWQYRTSLDLVESILWMKVVFFLDLSLLLLSAPLKKIIFASFSCYYHAFRSREKKKRTLVLPMNVTFILCITSPFYWFYLLMGLIDEGLVDCLNTLIFLFVDHVFEIFFVMY